MTVQVLAFTVGGERQGVDVREVHRVLPAVPRRVVKGAPAHLAGIVQYHGAPVTVIDLQAWSGGEPVRPALVTRLIVLDRGGAGQPHPETAVIAERVDDVIALDDRDLAAGVVDEPGAPWRRARVMTPAGPLTIVSLAEWARAAMRPGGASARERPGAGQARPVTPGRTGGPR